MSNTQTPGEMAYAACAAARYPDDARPIPTPFVHLAPRSQRAWEAGAAAVRADAHTQVRTVLRHWYVYGPDHAFAARMHALETWLAQGQEETRVGTKTPTQVIEEIRRLVGHYFAGVDPEAFVASLRSEE